MGSFRDNLAGKCAHCFEVVLVSLVVVVLFSKAKYVKEKMNVTEFIVNAELALKVNHKNILMLFTQKRAVV